MGSLAAVRVVIADDHQIWRAGVRADLGDNFEVVDEAGDGAEAVEVINATKPDLVLCDLNMPNGGGIRVATEFRRVSKAEAPGEAISVREREVLQHVARGHTYREIGEELFIAEKTVENHVRNILAKLHLNRKNELMRYAVEHGID